MFNKMKAFKAAFTLVLHQKTWVIALLALVVVPVVFPYMTPYEYNLGLLEPSRAQAAWGITLFLSIFWGLHISARLGEYFQRTNLIDYFYSMGMSKFSLMGQTFLVSAICFLPLVLISSGICIAFCSPNHLIEAEIWKEMTAQFAMLLCCIFLPLNLLAIALAVRFSALVSYVITVGLAIYGFYGVGYLEQFLDKQPMPLLDAIWHISPHYHVGDLTTRFIFKMGDLPNEGFMQALLYLNAIGLLLIGMSSLLYMGRKSRSMIGLLRQVKLPSALIITSLLILPHSQIQKSFVPNPLGVYGSEFGRTIALAMQSPIELFWHEGADHHHGECGACASNKASGSCEKKCPLEPHMHVIERKKELPKNLKGFITKLDDNKKKRTNPYADSKQLQVFSRRLTEGT